MKIGRNQPCPCGSGKKFKRCHGNSVQLVQPDLGCESNIRQQMMARERVRQTQQGFGRPIISANIKGHQFVAVGDRLHHSSRWRTFPDFLADFIKTKLDPDWGNAEIAKPFVERHPLMQWYDALCKYQQEVIKTPGVTSSCEVTGVVACYLGVAYGLYLLDHNVELQERLIRRLKDPGNFQGAYYELMVARSLILAGFRLTLEDETDPSTKHCEFAAVSPDSGKRYWVEAKMRAVTGYLGRTASDGTLKPNPLSSMVKHLNGAFAKPAADERMIFIDLNAEMPVDVSDENRPDFITTARKRLEEYERKELPVGQRAYVFITNATFHRNLEGRAQSVAFPFGLGIPDFNRSGMYRLSDWHEQERKHADAIKAADGLGRLVSFPSTFDGSMPSVGLAGERVPVVIGQIYNFEGAGERGEDVIGTVTDAIVIEQEKTVMVAVSGADGVCRLLKESMSDQQLSDYKSYPDAYFGKVMRPAKGIKTPQDLFEFFMHGHRELPREELLRRLCGRIPKAEEMDHEKLLAIYCEGLVSMSGLFVVKDGVVTAEHAFPSNSRSS